MAQGINLRPTGGTLPGGSIVGPDNPMPVYTPAGYGMQVSYGTLVADLVKIGFTGGTAAAGLIFLGKDTSGTYYPVPLSPGGGAVNVSSVPTGTATTLTLTTTTATLAIPAASSGSSNYITAMEIGNTSATYTRIDLGVNGSVVKSLPLAASGGGFINVYNPPWKLAGTFGIGGTLSAAVTDIRVNFNYYVAP